MSWASGPAVEPTIALGMLAIGARLERGDRGECLAFEELEERAAGGGDVVDVAGDAELVDRRHGVAAARDGVGLRAGDGARNRFGAFRERIVFEHADRAVPDDGAGLLERCRERLRRLG